MGEDRTVKEGGKRWIISFRSTAEERQRLRDAADENGRSLTDEIETRLKLSLQRDDFYGGNANAAFVSLLGAIIRNAETESGRSWRTDSATRSIVRDRVLRAIDEAPLSRPKPKTIKLSFPKK